MAEVGAPRHLNPVRAPSPVRAAPCGGGDVRPRGAQRRPKLREFHGWDAEERHAGVAALTVTSGL